ncbi:MAG: indolepyruvate oxidoreductase subunit beta [Desulfurococcaceae archaeon]|nr:indolepyruvate oxidoreductase subunit beta [Desulfurococcaceae archaeon]
MRKTVNILVASVGGQGGLTLSRVIARASVLNGFSVRTAETLGMSQRYGSVVSYVRLGDSVKSPLFELGEADYILGLELVETLRRIHYASSNCVVIVADEYKPSYAQSTKYPALRTSDLVEKMRLVWKRTLIIPARKLAERAGSVRALNMVILGAFNAVANLLSRVSVESAIREVLSDYAISASLRAYELGFEYAQQAR